MAAVAAIATLWSTAAMATITQGDFSVFGFFETREGGRWGEGSSNDNSTPTTYSNASPGATTATLGTAATTNGGSFDFNHWDLVEARQLADIRPDYHVVKNYSFLGRFDTLVLKDADFFGFYRPWYDAEGTLKNKGIAEPNTDAQRYTHQNIVWSYMKDDFREYYGQLNFTDNFSMRIGKQQVIWSEADALSGTEVTNPVNATWHGFEGAEAPEDTRTNLKMIKFNYIFPDFLKTANNELEAFIIPGDYQPFRIQADPRNPWVAPAVLGAHFALSINQAGQQLRVITLPEADDRAMLYSAGLFYDVALSGRSKPPSDNLENSEFGARYSTLLPIGNGLQASLIFLYEYRDQRSSSCLDCSALEAFTIAHAFGGRSHVLPIKVGPGTFIYPGVFEYGLHPGVPKAGTIQIVGQTDYVRNKFFGLTGTYYDNDVTDVVFRYDLLYQPDHAIGTATPKTNPSGSQWTELTRFIVAGDRPTYIPWISKQHTFLTFQYVATWLPDRPAGASSIVVPGLPAVGKAREIGNFAFFAVTNWLWNGQLTTGHVLSWDIDDGVGDFSAGYGFRYSRNTVIGMNMIWYLGRSGRITDPLLFSRSQRFNQLEFTFTYEI